MTWFCLAILGGTLVSVPSASDTDLASRGQRRDAIGTENAGMPGTAPIANNPLSREARDRNLAVPFQALGADRPAPFLLDASNEGYSRALDCLASAMFYEAGEDEAGQAAVAQVVLNRLRHPAFPHAICAVVYQGAERTSGCQFTFTCDGSLHRRPSPGAWQSARSNAAEFLAGRTDPAVGMATHYHTDWVHPYWSETLDKIAKVGPHLFFRWRGGWGSKYAFRERYSGYETPEPKLAFLSAAHQPAAVQAARSDNLQSVIPPQAEERMLRARDGEHFILVDASSDGSGLAIEGVGQCLGQIYCKVVGWDKHAAAYGSPENPVLRTVAFLYVSDKRTGVEIVLWDCARFNRPFDAQCISDRNRRWITFQGDLSRAS